ncbi:MAG: hypothetical protein WAT79_13250 [Saprospiraceae bacterium]
MNFDIYIYGVPHGFNLFNAESSWNDYFQLFYDESTETSKLTIHRREDGLISYNYLRYKLISAEGRPGAFFGISVIFNNLYCNDVSKLFRFFENLYEKYILTNEIIIRELLDKTHGNAQFIIKEFKDQELEVKNIESIISKNLISSFSNDLMPLDSSFVRGNQNLILNINQNVDNLKLIIALKKYVWISISDDFPLNPSEVIVHSRVKLLNDYYANYKSTYDTIVIKPHKKEIVSPSDCDKLNGIIGNLAKIQEEIKIYINSQIQIKSLYEKAEDLKKNCTHVINNAEQNTNERIIPNGPKPEIPKEKTISKFIKFIKSKKFIFLFSIVSLILLAIFIYPNNGPSLGNISDKDLPRMQEDFERHIKNKDFGSAWKIVDSLIKNQERIAGDLNFTILSKIREDIDLHKSYNTEAGWDKAIILLKKSKEFGNTEVIEQEVIDMTESKRLLQATNAFNIGDHSFVKSLCEIIIISDCAINIKENAKNLLNNISDEKKPAMTIKSNKTKNQKQTAKTSAPTTVNEKTKIILFKCLNENCDKKESPDNLNFKKGDILLIEAKKGSQTPSSVEWNFSDNKLFSTSDKKLNPLKIKLEKTGKLKIKFLDQGVEIEILQK